MAGMSGYQDNKLTEGNPTDLAWEEWGRLEPYYSVLTQPQYRMSALDSEAKREFFVSGQHHAQGVLQNIRRQMTADFTPRSVLDFGCGVGRLVIPFARIATEVVGLDVSPGMLREAEENCRLNGISNVKLLLSDDSLSVVASQKFDLVHSSIVLQHIPTDRGKLIFRNLLECVAPGGVVAVQLLYGKSRFASSYGVAPEPAPPAKPKWYELVRLLKPPPPPRPAEPEMQMNAYNLNELLFIMQMRGVTRFFTQFTDHAGELGVWLFFQLS
jgi:SAM-dependent methyltransferase